MNNPATTYPAVIVGGGPVGLFLGICLERAGIPCRILEKRSAPTKDSRSLGIHPPSLECFEALGIAGDMTHEGVAIYRGHAYADTRKIGSLSFEACPKPFNFVLSLPQSRTEQLLEAHLHQLNSRTLIRNARVVDFMEKHDHQSVTYQTEGSTHSLRARYVIGCDGKESFVRKHAGISLEGGAYPDTYVMGDFSDNTDFGSDAVIFLCGEGLVESFPLPGNRRRWVVKTDTYHSSDRREIIEQALSRRIGHSLSGAKHLMLSSFGVQKRVARQMVKNRTILAGDAAHVVSPIGGQGMNLGWIGAWDLAQCLIQIFNQSTPIFNQSTPFFNQSSPADDTDEEIPETFGRPCRTSEHLLGFENQRRKHLDEAEERANHLLRAFENRRRKAARNAIRRGEINMRLGRKARFPSLRNRIVSLMLNTPLSRLMARMFTMRGIDRWII